MERLFGTDGIRGEAGKFPLDKKTIWTIGISLAKLFGDERNGSTRFVIGRDTRESGQWIESAFAAGAFAGGAECVSAGIITTPGVAFLAREGFDAGIVISASHNPYRDNGVKVFLPSGRKLNQELERSVEKFVFEQTFEYEKSDDFEVERADGLQSDYVDYLSGKFNGLKLADLRIVVDCANGAASELAPQLFQQFGAEVVSINVNPDGKNINRDCGSLHLEELRKRVLQDQAQFGVAFDGDADRALFVDEHGAVVDGDATLWVMAQHLKKLGKLPKDIVVATVMSNIGLEIALNSIGINLLRASVGDKYVLQKLLETGSSIGGEQSGHIIFPFHSLVGDGMQTTLFLLDTLMENGKTLAQMVTGFTRYPQVLVNVRVKEKKEFREVDAIAQTAKEIEGELGQNGRLLLRYSGTENLARVMIEGKDQAEIERMANRLAGIIGESLG